MAEPNTRSYISSTSQRRAQLKEGSFGMRSLGQRSPSVYLIT